MASGRTITDRHMAVPATITTVCSRLCLRCAPLWPPVESELPTLPSSELLPSLAVR